MPALSRSRLPAHGKAWKEARRQGLAPAAGIFGALVLLDHWRIGPKHWPVLVIPDDLDPENADFSMLSGLHVTLAYRSRSTSDDRLMASITAMLGAGAAVVATLDRDGIDRCMVRRKGGDQ